MIYLEKKKPILRAVNIHVNRCVLQRQKTVIYPCRNALRLPIVNKGTLLWKLAKRLPAHCAGLSPDRICRCCIKSIGCWRPSA